MDSTTALGLAHQRLIWKISLTIIHALGILTAIYRISRRHKTRQSGLDDFAATLALIFDLIYFPTLWLTNEAPDHEMPGSSMPAAGCGGWSAVCLAAKIQTRVAQVVIAWFVHVVYPLLTWSAKTSLALTIARLIPPSQPTRRASIIVAYLSTLIGIGILIQTCIYCSKVNNAWSHASPYRCKVAPVPGFIRLVAEVIIDVCLVLIPFCTFFGPLPRPNCLVPKFPNNNNPVRLRLPTTTLRLIKVCFMASLLTTSAAIVMMILLPLNRSKTPLVKGWTGYLAFVLTHLTASVSLLVCNLLIVVTSLYRFLRPKPGVVEVGKSPVIPDIPDRVNSGSEPASNAASSLGERVAATDNASEDSSPLRSGVGVGSNSTGNRLTARTDTPTSSNVELTELFESDFSEFQSSMALPE